MTIRIPCGRHLSRKEFLALGGRSLALGTCAYGLSRLAGAQLLQPATVRAGSLAYRVTSARDSVTTPAIQVALRPAGLALAEPHPTPFVAQAAQAQVHSRVPRATPLQALAASAGRGGFRLSIDRAENLDGARFDWDFGDGRLLTGPAVEIQPTTAGSINGLLTVSDGGGQVQAQIPVVRLVAYDTPAFLTADVPRFATEAHINFDTPHWDGGINTLPDVQKAVDRVKEMDMYLVRCDWIWSNMEPAAGSYNWNVFNYQDVLGLLTQRSVGCVAVVKGTPQWATSSDSDDIDVWWNSPPQDPRAYGEFIYHFIQHYGPVIKMLEVYQEPNCNLYWNFDAAGLAACQREAFLHAKYANPHLAVGLTGLVGIPRPASLGPDGYWHYGPVLFESPDAFLDRVYQATGGHAWWDAVGLHTYPDMELFNPSTGFDLSRSLAFVESIKTVMRAHGDASPLTVTEIGTSTPGDQPAPQAVAAFLGQLIDGIRRATNTPLLVWYRLNEGPDPNNPSDRRGLATYDLNALTPIGQTMRVYVQQH